MGKTNLATLPATLKIDQVTMSEVVEVSESPLTYITYMTYKKKEEAEKA